MIPIYYSLLVFIQSYHISTQTCNFPQMSLPYQYTVPLTINQGVNHGTNETPEKNLSNNPVPFNCTHFNMFAPQSLITRIRTFHSSFDQMDHCYTMLCYNHLDICTNTIVQTIPRIYRSTRRKKRHRLQY
jgi:hypothetical protein